jgi:hypothetical protein
VSGGRTSWWPKDAAWHRRELIVELGTEHGPAGPCVMDVLSSWAQEQRAGGAVRGGFLILAREAFVSREDAQAVVEHAGRIGALDDVEVDDDGRRFACRVSGWQADQAHARSGMSRRSLDPEMRARVMRRFDFTCVRCSARPEGDWSVYDGRYAPRDGACVLHLDHVVPLSLGGADAEHNIQVLCSVCNIDKGASG